MTPLAGCQNPKNNNFPFAVLTDGKSGYNVCLSGLKNRTNRDEGGGLQTKQAKKNLRGFMKHKLFRLIIATFFLEEAVEFTSFVFSRGVEAGEARGESKGYLTAAQRHAKYLNEVVDEITADLSVLGYHEAGDDGCGDIACDECY